MKTAHIYENLRASVPKLRQWQTVGIFLFLLVPILFTPAGSDKIIGIIGLSSLTLLFLGCVLLIPKSQLTTFYCFMLWVFLFGFFFAQHLV